MKPIICGLSAPALTADERAFFTDLDPAGYILFARNIVDRAQLRAFTDSLRDLSGRDDLPILIDQEGGRVQRMKPPVWPAFPAGPRFDALYETAPISAIEAARANAHAIGLTLAEVGVTVNCLPLLDVARPDTTDAVAGRAYGHEPLRVAAMGRAVLEGLAEAGVVGVVKHMPGHGRAQVDTHHLLPTVTASRDELDDDFAPFRALADAPMGMTSHIVFDACDPDRPATLSTIIVNEVIRGEIGFDGLLMTDDIDMKALHGAPGDIAAQAIAAGCDVILDCWASIPDMTARAAAIPDITAAARGRLDRAMASAAAPRPADLDALVAKRDALLARA